MPTVRPPMHGRDNRIGGADPIPPGEWIYVGGTADPGWTELSPEFQNGWGNAGGGLRRLRFRLTNEDQVEIEGSVTGGTVGTTVCTLPDVDAVFRDSVFWPAEATYAVGAAGDESVAVWLLETDGDLVYVGTVVGVTVPELEALGFLHWGVNNDANSDGLVLATDASVLITTDGSDFDLQAGTGGDVSMSTDGIGAMDFTTENGNLQLRTTGSGTISVDATGSDIDLTAVGDIDLTADNRIDLEADSVVSLTSVASDVTIDAADDVLVTTVDLVSLQGARVHIVIGTATDFTVFGPGATPMLRMTEGSPDLHLPAGGAIVFDL